MKNDPPIRVGCAGWQLRREHQSEFPPDGSHLERYAHRLPTVEINSSFYRHHKPQTYQRWADSTPDAFRFAVKIPKAITHEARLADYDEHWTQFSQGVQQLGDKLGPLLLQLPPNFRFDGDRLSRLVDRMRRDGFDRLACEPRHRSWGGDPAERLWQKLHIARVAADPPRVTESLYPAGDQRLIYYRLHGSPRVYYSSYDQGAIASVAAQLCSHREQGAECYCIFDNTAEGAAVTNALQMKAMLEAPL